MILSLKCLAWTGILKIFGYHFSVFQRIFPFVRWEFTLQEVFWDMSEGQYPLLVYFHQFMTQLTVDGGYVNNVPADIAM